MDVGAVGVDIIDVGDDDGRVVGRDGGTDGVAYVDGVIYASLAHYDSWCWRGGGCLGMLMRVLL